jgi:hypothetical protein
LAAWKKPPIRFRARKRALAVTEELLSIRFSGIALH